MPSITSWRFVRRSLLHYRRIQLAVCLGVAAATAVLTGALLIGDSMRGSLRQITLQRLGRIDELLITDRFFRSQLADSLAAAPQFQQHFRSATGAILLPNCTVQWKTSSHTRRASNVLLIAGDQRLWNDLGDASTAPLASLGPDQVAINQPLAQELGVQVGDTLTVRLPQPQQIPADSPLGRRDSQVRSLVEFEITAIIPAEGLGRFSLNPTQLQPLNAFLSLEVVQEALDEHQRTNAILVAGKDPRQPPDREASQTLSNMLAPDLQDYGLSLPRIRREYVDPQTGQTQVVYDYFSLTSDRMMIPPAVEVAADQSLARDHAQAVLTYLATSIEKEGQPEQAIPYSTITALDSTPQLGPLMDESGEPLAWHDEDDLVLTSWAADQLQAQPGDQVRVRYFAPETLHGEVVERSHVFTVRAIVPLTEPAQPYAGDTPPRFTTPPTRANDPDLTPTVEGITDQETIDNWDAPFPYDSSRLRSQDRTYWDNHRTTPKAYVPLSTGQELWGSRFGRVTSYRIPAGPRVTREKIEDALLAQLRRDQLSLGFEFMPLKRQGLQAAAGTTPFDVLFLCLSFFIIAAALLLVALLFRLGVDQRGRELGTLLAVGFSRRQITRLQLLEGSCVAAGGALLGTLVGVGYAWLMLAGLRSWWLGAVTTAFLELFITPRSLLIGFGCGVLVSLLTIRWSIGQTRRLSERQLLANVSMESAPTRTPRLITRAAPLVLLALSIVCSSLATVLGGEMQALAFVAGGALVLVAILLWIRNRLRRTKGFMLTGGPLLLGRLAGRNAARNPGRSGMTIGLMATASFLIVAMSSFRLSPTDAGSGGFDLVAESSVPIFEDLNDSQVREDLWGDEAAQLAGSQVLALRVKPGDDASCRNLFQSTQPRILGITPQFIQHFDDPDAQPFSWADSDAQTPAERANPWRLLDRDSDGHPDTVPVVLDKNTAMYSLHMYGGVGQEKEFTYDDGHTIRFRVVGLLSNSVFQGSLLIGQSQFERLFPQISGYRYFLIQSPPQRSSAEVAAVLEDRLGDQGLDATPARRILEDLLAVQNTYLSAFQSLGALGLLLGAFGLAAVQLRNVLERRAEMALMRASGFSRQRLATMVMLENVCLLLGGLATGVLAALVAVLPHMLVGGATIPLASLAVMLAIILISGLAAGAVAVRATMKAPLVAALRGE